jgi:hypothetical protein
VEVFQNEGPRASGGRAGRLQARPRGCPRSFAAAPMFWQLLLFFIPFNYLFYFFPRTYPNPSPLVSNTRPPGACFIWLRLLALVTFTDGLALAVSGSFAPDPSRGAPRCQSAPCPASPRVLPVFHIPSMHGISFSSAATRKKSSKGMPSQHRKKNPMRGRDLMPLSAPPRAWIGRYTTTTKSNLIVNFRQRLISFTCRSSSRGRLFLLEAFILALERC